MAFASCFCCTAVTHSVIPRGLKQDVYCVVQNGGNAQLRQQGKRSNFEDDCGVWESAGTSSSKYPYEMSYDEAGKLHLKRIFFRDKLYCSEKVVSGKRTYIAFDPQPPPNNVIVLNRYYTQQKHNPLYRKRVTFAVDACRSAVAVVEYCKRALITKFYNFYYFTC